MRRINDSSVPSDAAESDQATRPLPLSRRQWLAIVPGGVALAATGQARAFYGEAEPDSPGSLHPEFPSHDPTVVAEVVIASHGRIDRLRELVEASPALAKATWDAGFGDWESALGAASHMGRRDIAELLIHHGARPNLFTFAMLGHLEVVKSYVEAMPGIQKIHGPHGITLLKHARHGGDRAKRVVRYLESVGDADVNPTSLEVSDQQQALYVGRYTFGKGKDDAFEVLVNRRGMLAIQRGERFSRVLNRVEDHGFAPAGATAVRVRFEMKDGRATALTVHDPIPLVRATRDG